MSYRVSIFVVLLAIVSEIRGQDVYYAAVQDLNIWYNPSLKTTKLAVLHANFRNVNYEGITAYNSKAATVELPLTTSEKKETDNIPFVNLAIGINADNASNNALDVSTAMLSLSYALPLNNKNTYLALGFQGNYTFSKVAYSGSFPGSFDQYGALGAAISSDPLQSGYQYNYFTAGAGVTLFQTTAEKQWYIGGSLRHINQPYTDWTYSARLPMNASIQAGYAKSITEVHAPALVFNLTGVVALTPPAATRARCSAAAGSGAGETTSPVNSATGPRRTRTRRSSWPA